MTPPERSGSDMDFDGRPLTSRSVSGDAPLHPPSVTAKWNASGVAAPLQTDGRHDFDFLIGRWNVRHRRLKGRLSGSTAWDEFSGTCTLRTILGGLGNLDENVLEAPSGRYEAITLRLFDPARKVWSIFWFDARYPGPPGTPLVGRFENGLGLFYEDTSLDGKPVRSRFMWTVLSPGTCRWEQALSADGEKTWETNWIMNFTRA